MLHLIDVLVQTFMGIIILYESLAGSDCLLADCFLSLVISCRLVTRRTALISQKALNLYVIV